MPSPIPERNRTYVHPLALMALGRALYEATQAICKAKGEEIRVPEWSKLSAHEQAFWIADAESLEKDAQRRRGGAA